MADNPWSFKPHQFRDVFWDEGGWVVWGGWPGKQTPISGGEAGGGKARGMALAHPTKSATAPLPPGPWPIHPPPSKAGWPPAAASTPPIARAPPPPLNDARPAGCHGQHPFNARVGEAPPPSCRRLRAGAGRRASRVTGGRPAGAGGPAKEGRGQQAAVGQQWRGRVPAPHPSLTTEAALTGDVTTPPMAPAADKGAHQCVGRAGRRACLTALACAAAHIPQPSPLSTGGPLAVRGPWLGSRERASEEAGDGVAAVVGSSPT